MSEEQKQEVVKEEVVSQEEVQSVEQTTEEVVEEAVEKVEEEVKEDRPERNYKAEIARKNAEIERLRALASQKPEPVRHDPNDLATWDDVELKAIIHSNDPAALALKSKAEDILIDRKINAKLEGRIAENKNKVAEAKLRKDYPEALDVTSDFALKMEEVMEEYSLPKSPAGRLAAAKIVGSDMKKGASSVQAKGRKAEQARIASVKGEMIDGDRPKSIESNPHKKQEQALKDLESRDLNVQTRAFGDILKSKGLTGDTFFKR